MAWVVLTCARDLAEGGVFQRAVRCTFRELLALGASYPVALRVIEALTEA
jgi:hypothetical protein